MHGREELLPLAETVLWIASFTGRSQYDAVMAASVVVTVPLVVLVLIFQRKILGGLTAGAVKG